MDFVLRNTPSQYTDILIKDYVEGLLDIDVKKVYIINGLALVTLAHDLQDFEAAKIIIKENTLESNKISLIKVTTRASDALTVYDIDEDILSEQFLSLFFQSEFDIPEENITECKIWPTHRIGFLRFTEGTDISTILTAEDYIPLPSEDYHIQVGPYYAEFHDVLNKQWSTGCQDISLSTDDSRDSDGSVELKGNEKVDNRRDYGQDNVTSESDSNSDSSSESEDNDTDSKHDNNKANSRVNKNVAVSSDSCSSNTEEESQTDSDTVIRKGNREVVKTKSQGGPKVLSEKPKVLSKKTKHRKQQQIAISDSESSEEKKCVKNKTQKEILSEVAKVRKNKGHVEASNSSDSSEEQEEELVNHKSHDQPKALRKESKVGKHKGPKIYKNDTHSSEEESSKSDESNENSSGDEHESNESEKEDSSSSDESEKDVQQKNSGTETSPSEDSVSDNGLKNHKQSTKVTDNSKRNNLIKSQEYSSNYGNRATHIPPKPVIIIRKMFSKQTTEVTVGCNKSPEKKTGLVTRKLSEQAEDMNVTEEKNVPKVLCHILKKCFGVFENCTVEYDATKETAVFKGMQDAVTDHKTKMLEKIRSIKMKELPLEILSNVRAKGCVEKFLKSRRVQVAINNAKLTLASKHEDVLYSTIQDIKNEFKIEKMFKSPVPIDVEELENLKMNLEKKNLVFVSWNGQNTEIYLVSCKQDLDEAEKEIHLFLKSVDIVEKEFSLKGIKAKYVYKYIAKKFYQMLKDVEVLEQSEGEDGITVKFKASYDVVDNVYSNLCEFANQIEHQVFDLTTMYSKIEDLTLVVLGLNTDEVKQQINEMEKTEKCIIQLNIPDSSCIKPVESELGAACKKFQTNNSSVTVKTGDLHKEKSEIIVMFVDKKDNSFEKRKSLFQHEVMLDDDMTDGIQVFMNTDTLSLHVRTECCVLVGQHDQSSLSSLLDCIVNSILDEALSLGASTISISSKTLNKLFNSTTADISEALINSVHSFLEENDLSRVNVVVNKDAFEEFITVASTAFTKKDSTDDDNDGDSSEDSDDSEDESTKKITVGYLDLDTSDAQCVTVDICFIKSKESAKLALKLQKLIETECLYTSKMSNEAMDFWPLDFIKAVEEKAKGLHIYVEMTDGNDRVSHTIKGKKQSVDILEDFFKKEIMTIIKKWPKHCISSSSAPTRQTIEFLGHASGVNETCPSYWKLYKEKSFWEKYFKYGLSGKKKKVFVKVDEETKKAVTDLVLATWDSGKVGLGADATGLQKNTTIEVLDVRRIENPVQFQQYANQRKVLFNRMSEKGKVCDQLLNPIKTTELLKNFMKRELYGEVNEHYLFHGTKPEYLDSLSKHGLDPKLCSQAMMGNGIYTAEMSTKADQYTDSRPKGDGEQRSQPGTELVMLLTRVLLGNIFAITRDHPNLADGAPRLRRPPCKDCSDTVCFNKSHEPCDSVMLQGKGCLFREFVVYDCSRCYPEYKITYKRIAPQNV